MANYKRYPNRLGVAGWAIGGRWGVERYLYTLHRLTGLGLLCYFLLHILVTSTRALGPEAWAKAMSTVNNPLLHLGEFFVFLAFVFHAANGVRLFIIEMGWGVGKAEEPVYPYRTSLNVQRPLLIAMMILAAAIMLFGGVDFWRISH